MYPLSNKALREKSSWTSLHGSGTSTTVHLPLHNDGSINTFPRACTSEGVEVEVVEVEVEVVEVVVVVDLKGTMKMEKLAPSFGSGAGNSAVLGKGVAGGSRAASRSINDLKDQMERHKQTAIASGAATGSQFGSQAIPSSTK